MKKTYTISGMTCNSCKSTIHQNLNEIPEVESVEVNLEKAEAIIFMKSNIEISKLQNVLPSKFKIEEKVVNDYDALINEANIKSDKEKSKLQQLKPLFIILIYISVASVLMNFKNWNSSEVMLDFMGLFYIVFSFFKMLDLWSLNNIDECLYFLFKTELNCKSRKECEYIFLSQLFLYIYFKIKIKPN